MSSTRSPHASPTRSPAPYASITIVRTAIGPTAAMSRTTSDADGNAGSRIGCLRRGTRTITSGRSSTTL